MSRYLSKDIDFPDSMSSLSLNELKNLSTEIRGYLINQIAVTGGHIGANLGVVELTVAIHSIFSSPKEPILFDTGHQGYTHKLLTGRQHLFPTLNKYGGMNRFLTPKESKHDIVEASHAGTAISVGLGIAKARKLLGDQRHVVSVVGDSALAEGSSLEALNHSAVEKTNLVIIINDNGFAISPGFGGIHELLSSGVKRSRAFFEAMGFDYYGVINGHDLAELQTALSSAKESKLTPIIHVKTIKGYGWKPADNHPYRSHFSLPYDPVDGNLLHSGQQEPTYSDIAGETVKKIMAKDKKVICLTPSTLYATGLEEAFKKYPSRSIDPGMAEQHTLSMTVGLALEGFLPIIAYQSTFMQRAFDQLMHDVAFNNLPTMILLMRSGFSGYDNPTHHGIYDLSFMCSIPNLTFYYPKDGRELELMIMKNSREIKGPVVIMMPYGPVTPLNFGTYENVLMPEEILKGQETVFLAIGNKIKPAFEAANKIGAGLINLRLVHPIPEKTILQILERYSKIVTIEEGVLAGGVGASIAAILSDHFIKKDILRLGLPRAFIEPGSNEELCAKYGLDAEGILQSVKKCFS